MKSKDQILLEEAYQKICEAKNKKDSWKETSWEDGDLKVTIEEVINYLDKTKVPIKTVSIKTIKPIIIDQDYKKEHEERVNLEESYLTTDSSALFHGTPTKEFAQGILKEGLKYNEALVAKKYQGEENFEPLKGVYLSRDFGNAVRYSFMPQNVESYSEEVKQHPNGYVFEFSVSDLSQTTPDEDELGMALEKIYKSSSKPEFFTKAFEKLPMDLKNRLNDSSVNFETYALIGKFFINNNLLSNQVLKYLSRFNKNLVNYGTIFPKAYWIVPKPLTSPHLKDRQGTFNTFGGYANYAKQKGKRIEL